MPGELNLDQVRTFLSAYRTGSLSQAARELGVSQPTATAHIAALERDLGYALFERTPSGVTPNARAASLAADIAPHMDRLEQALWAARPSALEQERTIRLAGPAEYLSTRVLPSIAQWRPDNVTVHVQFGLAAQLLGELRAGQHDLVISSVPVHGSEYAVTPLYDEEFALVGSPMWATRWWAYGSGPDASEHTGYGIPVIAYAEELPIIRRWWRTVWGEHPAGLNVIASAPNLRTVTEMVVQGAGISVLPSYLVETQIAEGVLERLVEPEVAPLNTLFLVTRAGAHARDPVLAGIHDALLGNERAGRAGRAGRAAKLHAQRHATQH